MKNNISLDRLIHLNVALVGGYMGAHTLLLRGGNFGNAQTGNLVEMMIDIPEWNWLDFALRFVGVLLFVAAMVLSVVMSRRKVLPMKPIALAVDALGMVIAALLPAEMNAVVGLYPLFFISAFQWGTFSGAEGYSCSTIFSTNNLRQCVTGWTEYFLTHEEKPRHKAVFYSQTICSFLLGALFGGALSLWYGPKGMLFGLLPVGTALYLVVKQSTQELATE